MESINETVIEAQVQDVLRTCFDPEIPVNIVDLGLVYDLAVEKRPSGGHLVEVKMTLTAQGCGMGPTIAGRIAAELGIGRILVPRDPGTFSAWGMLVTDVRQERSMFGMIRNTYNQAADPDVLSAYSDNAAVIRGHRAGRFFPDAESRR